MSVSDTLQINSPKELLRRLQLVREMYGEKKIRQNASALLSAAYKTPGFLDELKFTPAAGEYTRTIVAEGEEGDLVLRTMEWDPSTEMPVYACPELCAELVVEGTLCTTELIANPRKNKLYHRITDRLASVQGQELFTLDACLEENGMAAKVLTAGDAVKVEEGAIRKVATLPFLGARTLQVYLNDPVECTTYVPASGNFWRKATSKMRVD